jgi:hypothetical protein
MVVPRRSPDRHRRTQSHAQVFRSILQKGVR